MTHEIPIQAVLRMVKNSYVQYEATISSLQTIDQMDSHFIIMLSNIPFESEHAKNVIVVGFLIGQKEFQFSSFKFLCEG